MTPTLALAYLFWTRHRRSLNLVGGYWLAVMICSRVLPAGFFTPPPQPSLGLSLKPGLVFSLLLGGVGGVLLGLILVFTFAKEAQLWACASGYPARLWILPLSARALVGWPMLWGSATAMLVWMALAWALRRPFDSDVPLIWPGLLSAVVLAWSQAIVWTPFPLPWVRLYMWILLTSLIVLGSIWLAQVVPSTTVCSVLAVLWLAAYGTALRGVARARRGDNVQWGWPAWLRWPGAPRTRRPFASAAQAQLWLEWRLHGLVFPGAVATYTVLWLPILLLVKNLDDLDREVQSLLETWLPVAIVMACIPPTVWACGIEMGRLGQGTYRLSWTYRLSSFLATRPVSDAMLVRTKFVTAAWSTLAGWGVLAAGLLLWLALSGYAAEAVRQFEAMRRRHAPGLFWVWLIFLAGGAIVLTWLQMVQSMWIGLSGSMRVIVISVYGVIAYSGLILLSFLLPYHPEYWLVFGRVLPWLAGAVVLFKSLAAAWSLHALKRRRLISSGVLWGMLAIWFALAAGLFAALYALLPDGWFSVPGVVLSIVLLLPLTRLALAPLALVWNRHR